MLISLHVFCAFLSLGLLLLRGMMQLNGKNWRAVKLLKILPHLSDTLLIISGSAILYLFPAGLEPFALLILYIIFAAKFFSKKASQPKNIFFTLSLLSFIGAISIAYFH